MMSIFIWKGWWREPRLRQPRSPGRVNLPHPAPPAAGVPTIHTAVIRDLERGWLEATLFPGSPCSSKPILHSAHLNRALSRALADSHRSPLLSSSRSKALAQPQMVTPSARHLSLCDVSQCTPRAGVPPPRHCSSNTHALLLRGPALSGASRWTDTGH